MTYTCISRCQVKEMHLNSIPTYQNLNIYNLKSIVHLNFEYITRYDYYQIILVWPIWCILILGTLNTSETEGMQLLQRDDTFYISPVVVLLLLLTDIECV